MSITETAMAKAEEILRELKLRVEPFGIRVECRRAPGQLVVEFCADITVWGVKFGANQAYPLQRLGMIPAAWIINELSRFFVLGFMDKFVEMAGAQEKPK